MGFNIDTDGQVVREYAGKDSKAVAEAIFLQNCYGGDTVEPGAAFYYCCMSLAREFDQLQGLTHEALVGRAFQLFDVKGDGMLDREEFVEGVHELLNPTTMAAKHLAERIEAGSVRVVPRDRAATFSHVKKIAIVGAGVAGLQLAERLTNEAGYEVTIFEKSGKVGGVWSENYADFGLQVPKELYEFPAFPYPKDKKVGLFPKGPEVQEYIETFASHFGINGLVKFHTKVVKLKAETQGGWTVTYAPAADDGSPKTKLRGWVQSEKKSEHFDFVAVCTGMYGWPPNMPLARGKENFEGDVMHSFHFQEREIAAGKKVVVVGGGKSAVDCAVAAVNGGAKEVTLLFREGHWPVPRYILNLIPFKFATYSRFGHALLPTHYAVSGLVWWLHALFTPVKWLIWRIVEIIFRVQFRIPREMIPKSRIEIDVFTGGQILTYQARDMIEKGKLKICKNSIDKFTPKGVDLAQGDGKRIECDLVVYGTGFIKNYDYLDKLLQGKLQREKDGLYLYRSMLPVNLPDLAFVGCEVSTFNNILTHGLQAAWLTKVLTGKVTLPPPGQMQKAVEKEMNWKRTWMPSNSARASIQQLHMPKYHDMLVEDMGYGVYRKSNPLFEILLPYNARDYRTIFGLGDRTAWMRFKTLVVLGALSAPPVALLLESGSYLLSIIAASALLVCLIVLCLPYEPPMAKATTAPVKTLV